MTTSLRSAILLAMALGLVSGQEPCQSDKYHRLGKCGGEENNFLRCPQGYWCSQYGYCGTTAEYRQSARCPYEKREDPEDIELDFSPSDQPSDYEPQDDTEGEMIDFERFELGNFTSTCTDDRMHQQGKCGTVGHGFFRCRYGEWCSKWGYCSKFSGAAVDALCPKESRSNPENITYAIAPDDDPDYVEPSMPPNMPTTGGVL